MFRFVCLFVVCLLFVCLFVCLLVCLFVCLFVCLSACLFVCLFVCVFVCLFACLFDPFHFSKMPEVVIDFSCVRASDWSPIYHDLFKYNFNVENGE